MKFFIPAAHSVEQEQWVYASIKAFLGKGLSARFSDRRICFLRWWQNGGEHVAEVGKPTTFNGETVVAILHEPGRNLYHICTPNRGLTRDLSILASGQHVTEIRDFEFETVMDNKEKPDWSRTLPSEDVVIHWHAQPPVLDIESQKPAAPRATV
jgi:hypothetical protein